MVNKMNTSLSAGAVIAAVLLADEAVKAITENVIPVFSPVEQLRLPYIVYRRSKLNVRSVAGNVRGAESAEMEVACYAASYSGSVELAEAVRAALDRRQAEAGGMRMRCCTLIDSSEDYDDDAYIQTLVFDVKV